MLLLTLSILQVIIFLTLANSFAVPASVRNEFIGEKEVEMQLENYLKLGNDVIPAKDTCSMAGTSCDFRKGEYCCPSLVCYMTRSSGKSECRFLEKGTNGKSEDEEILNVLRVPHRSLEDMVLNDNGLNENRKEEKTEEMGGDRWDSLKVIKMPPRLDDITELPKCKPINMKCNPISGIRVCCPDLDCIQVGSASEDFECRKASAVRDEERKIVKSTYEKGRSGGRLQWFLGGWNSQKFGDSARETNERYEESERFDDDEVLSA